MKITILTQYFPPEVGAPQNRLFELAVRMKKMGADVTIVTAMPNYPKMEIHPEYKGKLYKTEIMEGLIIHRCWIFVSKGKGIFKRLLNYYSFAFSSFWIGLFKLRKQDIIIVESPPLFLGKTAYFLKIFKRSKLVFNVSDLWPESAEKLGLVKNRMFLWMAYRLESFLYKRSWLITGQTQGIVEDIKIRFPKSDVYWLPNGVDLDFFNSDDFVNSDWRIKNGFSDDDFIFLYAGIIGHAQGLEIILHAANQLKSKSNIKFILLGSGPEKEKLLELNSELNLTNVFFMNPITKDQMPTVLASVDVALIPLKRLDLFKGAIPSKIFENLAMKKPVLLGVDGEARDLFITKGKAGLYFEPENINELVIKIEEMMSFPVKLKEMGENGYNYVKENFERDKIATEFWKKINNV